MAVRPDARRPRRNRAQSRADNRRALLDAAREVIVEAGYQAAQLDEIAERAGLTKGAIYSIFGGKLDLLRALVGEHAQSVLPLLALDLDADPRRTAEDVVRDLVSEYLDAIERPDALRILAFELDLAGLALRDPVTLDGVLVHERAVADRLAQALNGRPRRTGRPLSAAQAAAAADLVLGALGGLGQRLVMVPAERDRAVIADAVVRILPAGN